LGLLDVEKGRLCMNFYGGVLIFGMLMMAMGMSSLIHGFGNKLLPERERLAFLIGGVLLVVGSCGLFVLLWKLGDEVNAPLPGW
jgi:hypothetical protein